MNHKQVSPPFNVENFRKLFPFFKTSDLIYLDNAATTQKLGRVIDRLIHFYQSENANIHRSVHDLGERATVAYEETRTLLKNFLSAKSTEEIIFTKGTTNSINLLAYSLGEQFKKGDDILISEMEHHSNIVPWQILCQRQGCQLKVVRLNDNNELDLEDFNSKISANTKLVSIAHVSNALGTVNPVKELCQLSHKYGALVHIDGAQAVAHRTIDLADMDCDFYSFSAHKFFGPTGVGVLYGKKELLNKMPPFEGGGDMIDTVSFSGTTYNTLPYKFEAGTPNIAGVIAFAETIKTFNSHVDFDGTQKHEKSLLDLAENYATAIDGLKVISKASDRSCVLNFIVDDVHAEDLGLFLNKYGIAVRTGHHCTQPLHQSLGIASSVRASFSAYNTIDEVHRFGEALKKSVEALRI